MKYLFVLGKNPTLSLAEITTFFNEKEIILINNDLVLLDIQKIDPKKVIKKLGGTIKIASLQKEVKNPEDLKEKCLELIKEKVLEKEGKIKFGLSPYSKGIEKISKVGIEIKKALKEENINSRLVTSKEKTLSSVVVETNKLTGSGIELILSKHQNKILVGKTEAVQPFKELSKRDYGRPSRDDYSGMLPPKLAQILINLAGPTNPKTKILDPFCGSGTILTEALLMESKNIYGNDISDRAIKDTENNIKWVEKNFQISDFKYNLYNTKTENLGKVIKINSIDKIVTEPYLGPQRGKINPEKTIKELNQLYSKSIKELYKLAKNGAKLVMVWPVLSIKYKNYYLNPDTGGWRQKNPIPDNLKNNPLVQTTSRNTIIYQRPNQKVAREIIILKK